ncbi:MAG: DegV family protein [Anaerolineales bacterium]
MTGVRIVTDSTASLPAEIVERLNITWVPYYIHRGKQVLRDLVTAKTESFYKWMETAEELPTTASPGPGDYLETYSSLVEKGVRAIASIHMTSKGSGAYQAALAAKQMIEEKIPDLQIEVIDTLNVAMCQGWIAMEAAREAIAGASLDSVVAKIYDLIPRAEMIQTADTLRYLQLGGRIGKATQLVGSLLNIKPLIGMRDGVIVALGKTRSREKAYRAMVDFVESAVDSLGPIKIAYMHAAALSEAERLREMVEDRIETVEAYIAEFSPALGVHSGPGTTGLCYISASS